MLSRAGSSNSLSLPETVPDGLGFDVEGGCGSSCSQPSTVYRLAPEGDLSPTNTAFAGDELDVLLLAALFRRSLKAISPGVQGMPLAYPTLPESHEHERNLL